MLSKKTLLLFPLIGFSLSTPSLAKKSDANPFAGFAFSVSPGYIYNAFKICAETKSGDKVTKKTADTHVHGWEAAGDLSYLHPMGDSPVLAGVEIGASYGQSIGNTKGTLSTVIGTETTTTTADHKKDWNLASGRASLVLGSTLSSGPATKDSAFFVYGKAGLQLSKNSPQTSLHSGATDNDKKTADVENAALGNTAPWTKPNLVFGLGIKRFVSSNISVGVEGSYVRGLKNKFTDSNVQSKTQEKESTPTNTSTLEGSFSQWGGRVKIGMHF